MDMLREASYTTPNDRDILVTRLFDAPRATVFAAWTRPEHVARWWDPSGTPLAACEIDLRPQGRFRWVHRAPGGGEGYAFTGEYHEVIPPKKLVFSIQPSAAGSAPIGTLMFTEQGSVTLLTMTIRCATQAERDAMLGRGIADGTLRTLENLAAYLPHIA